MSSASSAHRKELGAYYTPPDVVATLVGWAVRRPEDRFLDPACGDGRFLALHASSTGVDCDAAAIAAATRAAPHSTPVHSDFFEWASSTKERFDCAAGNPPFIRYQRFTGRSRQLAQRLCGALGAPMSGLASSWAPYLIATGSLLKPGGRLAFVVPAEIGHAPYAAPLLPWMTSRFRSVRVVAIREKLFPELSEDVWLLFADGFGGSTSTVHLSALDRFETTAPTAPGVEIPISEWRAWRRRLRPFLLPDAIRSRYRQLVVRPMTHALGHFARVGIGYVSGDNSFFHLRPSQAREIDIPDSCLTPTVRRGRDLRNGPITGDTVSEWRRSDSPNFLLRLDSRSVEASGVRRHLDSEAGRQARKRYKCRVRNPWYAVPNVTFPDIFLSYMSGHTPAFVENRAGCACTNAVHAVHLTDGISPRALRRRWNSPLTALSCEIEGHPLGGGVLKLEPREALRVAVAGENLDPTSERLLREGVDLMQRWRHPA